MYVDLLRSTPQHLCHRMKLENYPAKLAVNQYQKASKLIRVLTYLNHSF
jgi:hypothetical protein